MITRMLTHLALHLIARTVDWSLNVLSTGAHMLIGLAVLSVPAVAAQHSL
jgi:hypothetical protein